MLPTSYYVKELQDVGVRDVSGGLVRQPIGRMGSVLQLTPANRGSFLPLGAVPQITMVHHLGHHVRFNSERSLLATISYVQTLHRYTISR